MANVTKKQYINRIRETLPHQFRLLRDDEIFSLAKQRNPAVGEIEFKPPQEGEPGFVKAIISEAELAVQRLPETGAAMFNIFATYGISKDDPVYEDVQKFGADMYKSAKVAAEERIANDPQLSKYTAWAGQNPFSWSKFVSSPSMFGRVAAQSMVSMGQIMAAGGIGTVLGGPTIGAMAAGTAAFALEGSEAYADAYQRATEKGLSEQDISRIAAESGMQYGLVSSVLESIVPLGILRGMGFGKRALGANFGRFSGKYLDNAAKGMTKQANINKIMRELGGEYNSRLRKIATLGRYMGQNSLMESATEASQFVSQQAILDSKIDGTDIDEKWLAKVVQDPEFHESIAGGLVGGGVMSGPGGISKARGTAGQQAAGHAQKLQGEKKDAYVAYVLDSKEITREDKVEFLRRMVELEGVRETEPIKKQAVTPEVKPEEVSGEVAAESKETTEPSLPKEPVEQVPTEQVPTEQMPEEGEFPGRIKKEPDVIPTAPKGKAPSQHALDTLLGLNDADFAKVVKAKKTEKGQMVFAQAMRAIAANKDLKEQPKTVDQAISVLGRLRREGVKTKVTEKVGDLAGTEKVVGVERPKVKPKVERKPKLVKTPADIKQLGRLGWSDKSIQKMTPVEAKQIIQRREPGPLSVEAIPKSEVEKKMEAMERKAKEKAPWDEGTTVKGQTVKDIVKETPVPKLDEPKQTSGRVNDQMTEAEEDEFLKPVFDETPSIQRRLAAKRLGWEGKEASAKSLLTNVVSKGSRTQSLLAKYILKNMDKDVAVRWGPKSRKGSVYQRRQGEFGEPIHGVFMYPGTSSENFTDTLLHEIVHAQTLYRLENPKVAKQKENLEKLWSMAVEADTGKELTRKTYGLKNVHEFISEAMTNREFQAWLDTIPSKLGQRKESIWQAIKRIIFKILGIPVTEGSVLAESLTQIFDVIETAPEPVVGDILYYRPALDSSAYDEAMKPVDDEGGQDRTDDQPVNPGVHMDMFLSNIYGVYIHKKKTYPKMVKLANEYKNRDLSDKPTFYEYENRMRNLIKKDAIQPIKIEPTGPKFQDALKEWTQRTNSRIEVAMGHTTSKGTIYDSSSGRRIRKMIEILNLYRGKFRSQDMYIHDLEDEDLATHKKNPSSETMNFVEEDKDRGMPIKLGYLSAKSHIYAWQKGTRKKDGKPYSFHKTVGPGDFSINAETINLMNQRFAEQHKSAKGMALWFFLADTSGDNAQIVLSAMSRRSDLYGMDEAKFKTYLAGEVAAENMSQKHADDMLASISRFAATNPMIYSQMAGMHHRMKQIKGRRYLRREKNITDTWRRLKLDLSDGWTPRGMGDSKIMYVDTEKQDIVFEQPDQFGNMVEVPAMHGSRYRNDGWLMTSQAWFDKLYAVSGVKTKVLKSVIRYVNRKTLDDYIAIKMEEKVPFEGTKVYERKDGEKVLLAKYEKGKWFDAKGEEFHRFGTLDEIKDTDGIFNQTSVIHTLPEESTRIKLVPNKSKEDAAHPVLAHELSLSREFVDKNPAAKKYIDVVTKHYKDMANDYLNALYKFRDDPKTLRDYLYREMKDGEIPTDIQQWLELFPNGEGLTVPNIMRQITPIINNRFLNSGLYKMRQREKGRGTHLNLKPRGGLDIARDSMMVSADNKVVRKLLAEEVGSDDLGTINNWLERNDYWVLVHRQPIQSFTKIQPRKIQRLVDGHGESVFLTENDVFRLHEGDFDGDTIFLEKVSDELIEAYQELMKLPDYNKRNRTIYLEMFQKGPLGGSLSDYGEMLKVLSRNARLVAVQGNVVNSKTMLHTLSYKGIKFNLGKIPVEVYNPEDKIVLRYMPLNTAELDNTYDTPYGDMTLRELIVREGDEIVTEGDVSYLRTTKENEFSILIQAAVDNEKFGLFNRISFYDAGGQDLGLNGWLLTRIFKRPGSDERMNWTFAQVMKLRNIYNFFNYSRDRQGLDDNRNLRGIRRNMERSKEVAGLYFDVDSNRYNNAATVNEIMGNSIFESIYKEDAQKQEANTLFKNFTTAATDADLRMTPQEIIISSPGIRDIIDEAELYARNINLENPLVMAPEHYNYIHMNAMMDIIPDVIDDNATNEEVNKGAELGQRLGQAHYNVFEEQKTVLKGKGVSEEELENIHIKPEYSEGIQDMIGEFQDEFNKASDNVKKYATLRFLSGIVAKDAKGKHVIIKKVQNLLPLQLMHKPTIEKYGKAYAKYVYKPHKRMESNYSELTKKFAEAKEDGRCG